MSKRTITLKLESIIFMILMSIGLSAFSQKYQPNKESLSQHKKVPEWFKDAKLGIYFHWGPYTVPAYGGEWYPRWMYTTKKSGWGSGWKEYHQETYGKDFDYHEFFSDFTGEHFDAAEWAKLFKATGAKFAGPVAQHHDGFAMWDSDVNPWNAQDIGPKQDIVGKMLKALRNEGLSLKPRVLTLNLESYMETFL